MFSLMRNPPLLGGVFTCQTYHNRIAAETRLLAGLTLLNAARELDMSQL